MARDQQKWTPVLRPSARKIVEERMISPPNRSHFGGSCAGNKLFSQSRFNALASLSCAFEEEYSCGPPSTV
jgi:hypothetical protein